MAEKNYFEDVFGATQGVQEKPQPQNYFADIFVVPEKKEVPVIDVETESRVIAEKNVQEIEKQLEVSKKTDQGLFQRLSAFPKTLVTTPIVSDISPETKNLEFARDAYKEFIAHDKKDKNFFKSVFEGMKKVAQESDKLVPFFGNVFSFSEAVQTTKAQEKKRTGQQLSSFEKSLLFKQDTKNLPSPRKGLDRIGYLVGLTTAQIPTYAIEFGLTGGVFSATKGAILKAGAKQFPSLVTKKGIPAFGVTKTIGGRVAELGASIVAGATQFAANVPAFALKTADYMLDEKEFNVVEGDNGNQLVQFVDKRGDSFPKAFIKAFGVGTVEYVSERAGIMVQKPLDFLKKAIIGKWLTINGVTTPSQAFRFIKKAISWNGIIGEVFEEEVGEALQAPIEGRKYTSPFLTPEGSERLLVETLSIGAFAGTAGVTDATAKRLLKNQTKRETIKQDDLPTEPPVIHELTQEEQEAITDVPIESIPFIPPEEEAVIPQKIVSPVSKEPIVSPELGIEPEIVRGRLLTDELPPEIEEEAMSDWQENFAERYGELTEKIQELKEQKKEVPTKEKETLQFQIDEFAKTQADIEQDFLNKWEAVAGERVKTIEEEKTEVLLERQKELGKRMETDDTVEEEFDKVSAELEKRGAIEIPEEEEIKIVERPKEAEEPKEKIPTVKKPIEISKPGLVPKEIVPKRVAWKRIVKGNKFVKIQNSWGTPYFQIKSELPKELKDETPEQTQDTTIEKLGENLLTGKSVVAEFIETAKYSKTSVVGLQGEGVDKFYVNRDFLGAVIKIHPDAEIFVQGETQPVEFRKNNELVGLAMAIKEIQPSDLSDIVPLQQIEKPVIIPTDEQPTITRDRDIGGEVERGELPGRVPVGEERPGERGEISEADYGERGVERPESGIHHIGSRLVPSLDLNKKIEALVAEKGDNSSNYSPEELEMLALYTGSGGRAREGAEGRGLLDEYYTPQEVVELVWAEVAKATNLNISPLNVLEPSIGTGRFLYYAPNQVKEIGTFTAYEINETSATIAQILSPQDTNVIVASFESLFMDKKGNKMKFPNIFDVVIGNPPYGEHRGLYLGLGEESTISKYEEYFLKRGIDVAKDGGVIAMVVPSGFLRSGSSRAKTEISKTSKLVNAYRLPNKLFRTTDIGTDIVVFKKGEKGSEDDLINDSFFENNPENILGEKTEKKGRFGRIQPAVSGSIENVKTKLEKVREEIVSEEKPVTKEKKPPVIQERKSEEEAVETKRALTIQKEVTLVTEKRETQPVTPLEKINQTEVELWKFTTATGELAEGFENVFKNPKEKIIYANFYKGFWYNNFNYLQGNIYEKEEVLENDKSAISQEQYEKQKRSLVLVKPKLITVDHIKLSPQDKSVTNIKIGGEGLKTKFREFIDELPSEVFEDSSEWEIGEYMDRASVRGSDKERNRKVEKRRRRVGNNLFNRFLQEILTDEEKAEFEQQYNRLRNATHKPNYKEVPIVTPIGKTLKGKPLVLREIQRTGAGFLVNKSVGGLAFEVGGGKTLTSIIAANEAVARGWAKRPLFVVEKTNYKKWIGEITDIVPGITINLLENLGNKFKGNLATLEIPQGSFSVMKVEGFEKLGFTEETYNEITKDLEDIITDVNTQKSAREKEKDIIKIITTVGRARRGTTGERNFEDLGFDFIVLDEAHIYKNLFVGAKTKKGEGNEYKNVRGGTSSLRAIKAFFATQYILKKNKERNVILLTATPFTNSPLEYYSMLSFMARKRLRELGFTNVNDFMTAFMDLTTIFKIKHNQSVVEEDVVERFRNANELRKLIGEFFDFKSGDELGVIRPDKVSKQFFVDPNQEQLDYMRAAEAIANAPNAGTLRYINEIMNINISPYLSQFYQGIMPDAIKIVENSPKIKLFMEVIKQLKIDNPEGSRLFLAPRGIELHRPMREYLIKKVGYKPEQVAILSGAVKLKDAQIQDVMKDFNDGIIKVLIAGNQVLQGVDLQENTTHVFRLSLPYRPDEIVQGEGRAWRHGNQWKKIMSGLILMNNSIDPFLNQLLETKNKRTLELQKKSDDTIEIAGEVNFEELKMLTMTDPVKKLQAEAVFALAKEKQKLNSLKAEIGFISSRFKQYNEELKILESRKEELIGDQSKLAEAIAQQQAPSEIRKYEGWIESDKASIERSEKRIDEITERLRRVGGFEEAKKKVVSLQADLETQEKKIIEVENTYIQKVEQIKDIELVKPIAKEQDFTPIIEDIKKINETFFEKAKEMRQRAPSGLAAAGGAKIGTFEQVPAREFEGEQFKLFQKVEELVKKYAKRIGEDYLPRGARGVFYQDTENIRTKGMNDLSVIVHEITHYLSRTLGIGEKFISETSHAHKYRRKLTDFYEEYYPGAKRKHKLEKRVEEGIATLIQKYIEQPSTITQKYRLLVDLFLLPRGQFYHPIFTELIKDVREVVAEYQGLPALDKVGAKVTSDNPNIDKESFLNIWEKIRTFAADIIYPIEILAKRAQVAWSSLDPSLWLRFYNNANAIVVNNIKGKRGYWSFRNGNFVKLFEYNWRTLIERLAESNTIDTFAYYLVARREVFDYKRLDELKEKEIELARAVDEAKSQMGEAEFEVPELKKLIKEFKKVAKARKQLESVLENDGFTREEVMEAYEQNKDKFITEEGWFDNLVAADLAFLNDPLVQILINELYKDLSEEKGYASFRKQFFDEIVGEEVQSLRVARVGKVKISSLMSRTGSSKTIINPVFNALINHAEITRKGMKQVAYNSFLNVIDQFPVLFQKLQLKVVVQDDGKFLYPQEKDPNIIMTRRNYVRTPVLVDSFIKQTVDGILTYQNIGVFEKIAKASSRFFTKGTTGAFYPFTLINFVIDQVTALANTRNNYIPIYTSLDKIIKIIQDNESEEARFFEEFLVLGGEKLTFVGWQNESASEVLVRIGKEKEGLDRVLELLDKGVDILALPAKYSEIITRAGDYITARLAGKPQLVALEEAGRVSAPFHHIGSLGGGAGQALIRSIPFFNPTIQVLDQVFRQLQKDPTNPKSRQRYIFVTAAVAAYGVSGLALIMLKGSDDQKEQYKDLSPEYASKYVWFPHENGKDLRRQRIPDQMNFLATIINQALLEMFTETDYTFGEYIGAATSWLPQQLDVTEPYRALFAWIPQIVKPLIQVATNTKDFPEIRPLEGQRLMNLPSEVRYTDRTSVVGKILGRTELAKALNLSPIKLDYLIAGYTGRAVGFFTAKPGVYNPFTQFKSQYYFQSGRRIQRYYDMKQDNDADYAALQKDLLPLSDEDIDEIKETRLKLKEIDTLLDRYDKIELEDQREAGEIRYEILKLIEKL